MKPGTAPGTPGHGSSTRRRHLLRWVAFVVVAAAAVLALPRPHSPVVPIAPPPPPSAVLEAGTARAGFGQDVGFRSRERLLEHFHKHGREFDAPSPGSYLRLAQALRDRAAGNDLLEIVRPDGVITRFDRSSGSFLAFESDGTIRTFFKPNRGEGYFHDQAEEAHR